MRIHVPSFSESLLKWDNSGGKVAPRALTTTANTAKHPEKGGLMYQEDDYLKEKATTTEIKFEPGEGGRSYRAKPGRGGSSGVAFLGVSCYS